MVLVNYFQTFIFMEIIEILIEYALEITKNIKIFSNFGF